MAAGAGADDLGDLTARMSVDTSAASAEVENFARGFPGVGTAVTAVAATLVAAGVAVVDMGAKFDRATDEMAAKAGITTQQAHAIGDAFLATAGQTTFSAQQIVDAYGPVSGELGLVEGHALSVADATTVMAAAQNLAEATGAALSDTTAGLAKVMQAYQIPVSGAAAASDVLFNTSRSLNIPISDLADTVDKLHAKLGPLAPSLGDISSLLLDVESHGLTGNRALLLVSTGMNTLLSNTKPVEDEVKKLGLTLYDASGNFVGMGDVISQLAPKLAGMTEEQRLAAEHTLFGAQASKALDDTLLAGLPAYDKAHAAATQLGTAHQGAQKATDNLSGALDRAKAALVGYAIKIGETVQPALTGLVDGFTTKALPAMQHFGDWIQANLLPELAHLGEFITGAIVPAVQSLATWFGDNVLPVLERVGKFIGEMVIPALSLIGQHIVTDVLPALEGFGKFLLDNIVSPLLTIAEHVIPVFLNAIDFFAAHFQTLEPILLTIGALLAAVWVTNKIENWVSTASGAIDTMIGKFAALGGAADAAAASETGAFAAGGGAGGAAGAAAGGGAAEGGLGAGLVAALGGPVAAAVAGFAVVAASIYGLAYAVDVITGDAHHLGDQFNALSNPVTDMNSKLNVADENVSTLNDAMRKAPQIALAINQLQKSADFTAQSSYQQGQEMDALARAIKDGTVKTPQDVWLFGQAWQKARDAGQGLTPTTQQISDALTDLKTKLGKSLTDIINNFNGAAGSSATAKTNADTVANELGVAAVDLQGFGDRVAGLASGITSALSYAQQHAQQISDAMSHVQIPSIPSPSGNPLDVYGQPVGHQLGGIVPPGRWASVGEAGSELVFASPSGALVVPHGDVSPAGGNPMYITINVTNPGPTADDIARELGWALK